MIASCIGDGAHALPHSPFVHSLPKRPNPEIDESPDVSRPCTSCNLTVIAKRVSGVADCIQSLFT